MIFFFYCAYLVSLWSGIVTQAVLVVLGHRLFCCLPCSSIGSIIDHRTFAKFRYEIENNLPSFVTTYQFNFTHLILTVKNWTILLYHSLFHFFCIIVVLRASAKVFLLIRVVIQKQHKKDGPSTQNTNDRSESFTELLFLCSFLRVSLGCIHNKKDLMLSQ